MIESLLRKARLSSSCRGGQEHLRLTSQAQHVTCANLVPPSHLPLSSSVRNRAYSGYRESARDQSPTTLKLPPRRQTPFPNYDLHQRAYPELNPPASIPRDHRYCETTRSPILRPVTLKTFFAIGVFAAPLFLIYVGVRAIHQQARVHPACQQGRIPLTYIEEIDVKVPIRSLSH